MKKGFDNIINIGDAVAIMNTGEPFNVVFISYDKKRRTGGFRKNFTGDKSVSLTHAYNKGQVSKLPRLVSAKSPNSFKNATRNLKVFKNGVDTGLIRKMNLFLMIEFNGKEVIL